VRIAVFESHGTRRLGIVADSLIHSLPETVDLLAVLTASPAARAGIDAEARRRPGVPLDSVRLLPPVRPGAMRDFLTFEDHVRGTSRAVQGEDISPEWYEAPSFLFMNPHAVVGPGDEVEKPYGTQRMDFELEVAAVVCRDVRNVPVDEAGDCIGGYLIMNDWSARDIMRREMKLGLGPAKGKDFATTLGPWVVTSDELEPYRRNGRLDLEMTVFVNGVRLGGDRLGNMSWSFEEMLSYASRGAWLRAGDVIASGTCATGALAETWGRTGQILPRPLDPGDVVTMVVEGIGAITNTVVAPGYPDLPVPRARSRAENRA
jgi:2-keto-4-pentenoate hydratase/2-oxohepta-3-ene-1,7-dioic acid hydratase in catechol pathway